MQLNPDLLSQQERARFRGVVGVLLSCGLTFAPQSASSPSPAAPAPFGAAAAGAQEFALEPAVDQVCWVLLEHYYYSACCRSGFAQRHAK